VRSSASSSSTSPEAADAAETPNAALGLLSDGFDQHYAKVFRCLLHRFFDKELAEELTAETFCKAASATMRANCSSGCSARPPIWPIPTVAGRAGGGS